MVRPADREPESLTARVPSEPGNGSFCMPQMWLLGPVCAVWEMVLLPRARRQPGPPDLPKRFQSPWHVGTPVAPVKRMAVQDPAMRAATSFARRYNSALVGDMIAQAHSLQAMHIMNQVWPPIQT